MFLCAPPTGGLSCFRGGRLNMANLSGTLMFRKEASLNFQFIYWLSPKLFIRTGLKTAVPNFLGKINKKN